MTFGNKDSWEGAPQAIGLPEKEACINENWLANWKQTLICEPHVSKN